MTTVVESRASKPGIAVWKAVLLLLPIVLLRSFEWLPSILAGRIEPLMLGSVVFTMLALTMLFVLMLTTGQTHRYRSILFIALAISVPLEFIPWMIATNGSMALSQETIYSVGASFCPLTMPMIIIPALTKRIVIFAGELLPSLAHGAFTTMFFIWVGASLSMGRGWCSWGCFYGGFDELFSRLRRKPVIPHKQIDRRWIYLPFAILLAIVLLSAVTLSPIYCEWLCPFKVVTEFAAPTKLVTIIQMVIFVTLFIGLVIVLPLLTKRRVQCGLFCPFGAMQSFLNKINIFEVRIDPEKCAQCKRCIRECPTFSLDESSLQSGKPLITCTKCARCVDNCPKGAISYHIKGTPLKASPTVARDFFLIPAFVLSLLLPLNLIGGALYRIIKLITIGSML
jgi:ferredoxin-type protein NapH